jgi:hypothetical protein
VTGAAHQGVSELPGNRYLRAGGGRLSAQLVVAYCWLAFWLAFWLSGWLAG